jgi:hypothetical protein
LAFLLPFIFHIKTNHLYHSYTIKVLKRSHAHPLAISTYIMLSRYSKTIMVTVSSETQNVQSKYIWCCIIAR